MADDWTLTIEQQAWMEARHRKIYAAYMWLASRNEWNGRMLFAELKADGFKDVFGDMSWDEAYDRYEDAIEGEPT